MHFDYAAGPATAGAWLPLLHPSPLTAALSPPPHRVSAAAAGFAPIQIQGSLGPGSTISLSSSSSSNNKGTAVATAQPAGFWGQDGGFLGLGFSPASRAAVKQGNRSGWLRRKGRGSSSSSSSVSSSGGLPGGVDVGSGVFVPEKEWLVPQWGKMGLSVELELPGWPETDLVQVRPLLLLAATQNPTHSCKQCELLLSDPCSWHHTVFSGISHLVKVVLCFLGGIWRCLPRQLCQLAYTPLHRGVC